MKIYNSLTRRKEEFVPLSAGRVSMYVCGPTVYDEPHIGHARSAFIFDVVRRYLAHRGHAVRFVRNVTDVDDKIIQKARSSIEGEGRADNDLIAMAQSVSERYLGAYHRDMDALGILGPDEEPRATQFIPKMISFIETLISRGRAYAVSGDVYFDIKTASGYGKLSNQQVEKMESGTRIAPGEAKRDPLDFALWKSAKPGEPSWPSPWGPGRPGWHIECSAMSSELLGDEFDIHGGGIDLIFPHHENEIAQSEGAGKRFARLWMHNGLLTIDGEKMAKSLGNFITIQDFLASHQDPDFLKLVFLTSHYRSPVDYTGEKVVEAKKEKERFRILLDKIARTCPAPAKDAAGSADPRIADLERQFGEAMDDDFNTPLALARLFEAVTAANKTIGEKADLGASDKAYLLSLGDAIVRLSSVLGLDMKREVHGETVSDDEVERLIAERSHARKSKDFAAADAIRRSLQERGVILEDTKEGAVWRRKL